MGEIKMHELGNKDACTAKRNFAYALNPAPSTYMKKAGVIKQAIADVFSDKMKTSEVEKFLNEKFLDIPYASDRQRQMQAHDAYRQVARYCGSEHRHLMPGVGHTVNLGYDLDVYTNPDYIHFGRDEIEVIKIKTSKPTLTSQKAHEDLGLYAMIKYGRELVAPGNEMVIKASYYFLRKENDSTSAEKPNFDSDFFMTTGGRNIVSIMEGYKNDPKFVPPLDATFAPVVKKFVDGLQKEECDPSDCEKCDLFNICRFTDAPLAIKKTPVNRSLRDLNLTPAQEEVVEYEKGICRVNAGAGAGKTMVVALRTATLINKGVDPKAILLITFTNAGAEEMRTRIGLILDDFGIDSDIEEMSILTFNAFGDTILKEEFAKLGFTKPPKVIDDVERSRIIADLLNAHPVDGLDYRNFDTNMKTCMGALAVAKEVFAIVKAGQFSVGDFSEVHQKMGAKGRFASNDAIKSLIALYDQYDDKLRSDNLIEFSDQEVLVFELLHKEPYYLEKFGFEHIIVDEFQDSSEGQIELIKLLRNCPTFKSLMVVGDDSQAIFGFRNTTPHFILHFDEIMGEAVDDIVLVANHRSTPEVLDCANKMNAKRKDRIDKDLVATRASGKPVVAKAFLTKPEEKTFVIESIKEHLKNGFNPEDIAIITATKYELMDMADALGKENIPTVLLNPEPLIDNSRVRAAIALCNALRDNSDTQDMLTYANALYEEPLIDASKEDIEKVLRDTMAAIDDWHKLPNEAARKAGLIDMLEAIDFNEDEVYESLIETFKAKCTQKIFEYADDFYRFGSGAAVRRTHDYPGVVLTTAHSSKGLEWPVVYNMISKYDTPELHTSSSQSREMLEERKRLLFVSMTRARDELYVTGQYVAFGKRGSYTYNGLLNDAIECAGGTRFTAVEVERLRHEREMIAAEEKKAKKKKKKLAEEDVVA